MNPTLNLKRAPLFAWACALAASLAGCGGEMSSRSSPAYADSRSYAEIGYGDDDTGSSSRRPEPSPASVESSDDGDSSPAPVPVSAGVPAPMPAAPPMAPPTPPIPESGKRAAGDDAARGQVLIYTAELWIAVSSIEPSLAASETIAREVGGYMTSRDNASISLRVPAARFDEAIDRLVKLGDVTNRRVTAEDVTEEYRDLTLRIKNAEAIRDRLTELLAKATNVDDSISVENELGRVTAQIETMKGRLTYLRDRAALSTITLRFQRRSEEVSSTSSFRLPIAWLGQLGLGRLLNLETRDE